LNAQSREKAQAWRRFGAAGVAVVLVAQPILAATSRTGARKSHIPRDSFLRYSVNSIDALLNEAQNNARVRHLYAKHFGIPESEVVSYMRQNLIVTTIKENKVYTVYCAAGWHDLRHPSALPSRHQGVCLARWRAGYEVDLR